MVPRTTTWFAPPVLMVISPEPVVRSRLTTPETESVRSKCPSTRACSRTGTNRKLSRKATLCFFINASQAHWMSTFTRTGCHYRQPGKERGTLLLQNNLVAFFEARQNFGLGAVGDSYGERHLTLALLALGIRHFG